MKNLILTFILILSFKAQSQVVSGLYAGTLYNDTTKMLQRYEVALSEYRGKITGYSYTTFIANDTFYYGIRNISVVKKEGQLIIEDGKMIVNNFPESPAKGVRRISTIPLNALETDTITTLSGRWHTTKTKEYYSVPGSVDMKRDNDSSQSALISHLRELKILGPEYAASRTEAIAVNNQPAEKPKRSTPTVVAKEASAKPATVNAIASTTPIPYTQRKENVIENLSITADSLTISFYDNGVVDGDSISVYLNGENVLDNAKLTAAAIKKTVPVKVTNGELRLVLVAESLGTLPPNTGLLIIQDGTNKYNIRFSADLQTNAAIILRRGK
jgi:hypothetical protein